MSTIASKAFIAVSVVGIVTAVHHAWLEGALTSNSFAVIYAPFAFFFGIPYWVFGVVWFPLILVVGLWSTRLGSTALSKQVLILLTIGNVFTGYLWYLDIDVIGAYTLVYVALYAINYVLTALVVFQNRSNDIMRGYVYGTISGAIVGLLFGVYGVAACGIGGGIFGSLRNYVMPVEASPRNAQQPPPGNL